MNRLTRSIILASLTVSPSAGWIVGLPALSLAATASAVAETQKQSADAQKILTGLKKPGVTAEQRSAAVEQLLALGDEGPKRLAAYAAGEIDARRDAYLSKFDKAAAGVLTTRLKANGGGPKVEDEIKTLRKQSIEVSRGKVLTKEAIHDKCDPAIKRLEELLAVTPDQIAEQQSDLKTQRDEALGWVTIFHNAEEKIATDKRKGLLTVQTAEQAEAELAFREKMIALLATPMSKQDRAALLGNIPLAAKLDPEEAAAIADLNRLRLLLGIGALVIDPKLCEAARGHSADMVKLKFFDHASPVPGKEDPWKRAKLAGTSASAENIYAGSTKGVDAIKGWWYSPGHHANMMSANHRVGVGRKDGDFTQMFGE